MLSTNKKQQPSVQNQSDCTGIITQQSMIHLIV